MVTEKNNNPKQGHPQYCHTFRQFQGDSALKNYEAHGNIRTSLGPWDCVEEPVVAVESVMAPYGISIMIIMIMIMTDLGPRDLGPREGGRRSQGNRTSA